MQLERKLVLAPSAKDQMGVSIDKTGSNQLALSVNDLLAVGQQLGRDFALTNGADALAVDCDISVLQGEDVTLLLAALGSTAAGGRKHSDIVNQKGRHNRGSPFLYLTGDVFP